MKCSFFARLRKGEEYSLLECGFFVMISSPLAGYRAGIPLAFCLKNLMETKRYHMA
jgi:hypothetical protein